MEETNEEVDVDVTMAELDRRIREAESAEDVKLYSEAYANLVEADNRTWEKTKELETELKGHKLKFWSTVIAGVAGAVITGAIRAFADLKFQDTAIRAEKEDDLLVNYKKWKR